MPDWPVDTLVNSLIVSTAAPESIGHELNALGLTAAAAAWPTANKALFVPFTIYQAKTYRKMFWENGGTVSGNIDVGVYDIGGAKIVTAGSTAQSGASAIQEVDITDTLLLPGFYYLAGAMDNTTGQILRWGPSIGYGRLLGVAEMTSAFALPASVTLATPTSSYIPAIFLTPRTFV